jgi:hypothetical protein
MSCAAWELPPRRTTGIAPEKVVPTRSGSPVSIRSGMIAAGEVGPPILRLSLSVTSESPLPLFFVSVASKELRLPVSRLESTLMGILVSVADKGLRRIVRVDRLEGAVAPSGMQTAHLQV